MTYAIRLIALFLPAAIANSTIDWWKENPPSDGVGFGIAAFALAGVALYATGRDRANDPGNIALVIFGAIVGLVGFAAAIAAELTTSTDVASALGPLATACTAAAIIGGVVFWLTANKRPAS